MIADVLAQLGARRAFVVHGAGGIDELSPAGPNLVCEVVDGDVRQREIDPLELGVARCDPAELRGGTRRGERAGDPRGLRRRRTAARRSAILLNAAGAIAAAGHADRPARRARRSPARRSTPGAAAATRLEQLVASRRQAAAR